MFQILDKYNNILDLDLLNEDILYNLNFKNSLTYAIPCGYSLTENWVSIFDQVTHNENITSWSKFLHVFNYKFISTPLIKNLSINLDDKEISKVRANISHYQPYIDLVNYFANKLYQIRSE